MTDFGFISSNQFECRGLYLRQKGQLHITPVEGAREQNRPLCIYTFGSQYNNI